MKAKNIDAAFCVFLFLGFLFILSGCGGAVYAGEKSATMLLSQVQIPETEHEFIAAVERGDLEAVRLAMDLHPAWIDTRVHHWGSPPLCIAAWEEHPELVEFFISRGADIHGCHEKWRWMAIHEAADRGNLEIIKILTEAGADVNAQKHDGKTPLHLAIGSGNIEVVKYLISAGAKVAYENEDNWSLMHSAAALGDLELAKLLSQRGIGVERLNIRGQSPIFWSSTAEMVKFLLERGADIHRLDNNLRNALHVACIFGNADAAKAMIEAGIDINQIDLNGQTPLNLAMEECYANLAEFLQSKGAKAGKKIACEVRVSRDRKGTIYYRGKAQLPFCVWQQPERLFEYNKWLGVNWLVYQPSGMSVTTEQAGKYLDSTVNKGLFNVFHYRPGFEKYENVVGWNFHSEVSPLHAYEKLRGISPQVLLVSNMDLMHFLDTDDVSDYKKQLSRIDCLITHVWPEMYDDRPRDLRLVAKFIDKVRHCCKDLPRGEIAIIPDINCHSWTGPDKRHYDAPTVQEFRFQVWLALIHGADGVCLFPISFNPFVFNQTSASLAENMPTLIAEVQQFKEVLTADESDLAFELAVAEDSAILDVTTRRYDGADYIFVLNGTASETPITFTMDGLGKSIVIEDALKGEQVTLDGEKHTETLPGLELRVWKVFNK